MAAPYQPQLDPGSASSDFSGSGSIGAPIANALEYGGELVDQELHRRHEIDRDMQATSAGVALAQASTAIDKAAIDARENAGPAGAGHTQKVETMVDDQAQQALGQIRDPHIRQAFTQRWADLKSTVSTREYGWEAAKRVDYLTTNVQQATDIYSRQQAASPDLHALPNQLTAIHDTIYSTAGLDDADKAKLVKEQQRAVVLASANAMIDKNPQLVIGDEKTGAPGLLQSSDFNQYLTSEDIKTLRAGGQVEIRRQDAETRQAADRQKAADIQTLSLAKDQIGQGYIPTEDDWKNWQGLATRSGLDKEQFDLAVLKDTATINREFRSATPATLHQAVNELAAKVQSGKATPDEQVHLQNLRAFSDKQTALFNSDPYAFEANAGNAAPALDLNDPGSIRKRVAWADGVRQSAGLVSSPYLSNDEAKTLTDEIKTGPVGQLKVAAQLRRFGGSIGSQIAGNLAGGEAGQDLKLMVGFNDRVAEWYSRGVAAQQGKTVHVGSTDQATYQADQQAVAAAFDAIAPAIPVDMREAVRRSAINVAAGMAAEYGKSQLTGDELKSTINAALQRVTGRTGVVSDFNAPGGLAEWRPRYDGSPGYIWLPANVNSNQALSKLTRATKDDWIRAAGGAPYIMGSDGKAKPLNDTQLAQLNKYPLDLLPASSGQSIPGIYTPITPDGGHLVTKDGRPWQFDIRKLR